MKAQKSYYVIATSIVRPLYSIATTVYETANWTLHDTRCTIYHSTMFADGWNIQILFSFLCPVISLHCFRICERHLFAAGLYALLSNKDQLSDEFPLVDQCNTLNLILTRRTVITHFEKAAMNAVSTIFPNVQIRGCSFHLSQSWQRRIQSLDMSKKLERQQLGYFEVVGVVFWTVVTKLIWGAEFFLWKGVKSEKQRTCIAPCMV